MAKGIAFAMIAAAAACGVAYLLLRPAPPDEVRTIPAPPSSDSQQESVAFETVNGQELRMDLFRPSTKKPIGALLLLHGGGWVSGGRGQMEALVRRAAGKGFLAASADYRLAPANRWPAQLEDVQAAVRYLRLHAKEFQVDPDDIAAAGVSAGGQLSLFLGSVVASKSGASSRVAVVGSISGLHDLRLPLTPAGEKYGIVQALVGAGKGPAVAAASPILVLSAHSAPTYFIQGTADPLVPANQTQQASARLKALGVPEKAVFVPGMGHGLVLKVKNQSDAFDAMLAWIAGHLPHKRP